MTTTSNRKQMARVLAFAFIYTSLIAVASSSAAQNTPARAAAAVASAPGTLRVGAARVDITPPPTAWKEIDRGSDYELVHDPIYARALIIDSGTEPVAFVTLDIEHTMNLMPLRERIQRELEIAPDHIVISATHYDSGPQLRGGSTVEAPQFPAPPEEVAFMKATNDKILQALKAAKASMQLARMGVGKGSVDVSVNRDKYTPGRGWGAGSDPDGKSDKTVWVVKFETLSGEPIAIWFNYAVHSTVTFNLHVITGDLAGAASRVVEQSYDDKAVALFTSGAAGNQYPKFLGPGEELGGGGGGGGGGSGGGAAPRVGDGGGVGGGARPAGAAAPKRDLTQPRLRAYAAMDAQGWMLGSEVLLVAKQIQATTTSPRMAAAESVFVCPSIPGPNQLDSKKSQDFTNGDPIRLGVVRIDDTALAWVSAEIVYNIDAHLKAATPLSQTILTTLANDRSGYLVDDATYDTPNFEVRTTIPVRGCAESGVVNGLVDLIHRTGATIAKR